MEDPAVILCTKLVAERLPCPHFREEGIKSICWLCPLDLVIKNRLVDFSTLPGSQVTSGRNLLFKYIKPELHRTVSPRVSLGPSFPLGYLLL